MITNPFPMIVQDVRAFGLNPPSWSGGWGGTRFGTVVDVPSGLGTLCDGMNGKIAFGVSEVVAPSIGLPF
jgi:hypothetical protein